MKVKKTARKRNQKPLILTLCLVIVLLLTAAGATLAWLTADSAEVKNIFTPSHVSCVVEESFDGSVKSNVTVKNTGDVPAFVRIKLVSYRVNGAGQHIGGAAEIGDFTPGDGWMSKDGYYYYNAAVAPESSAPALISSLALVGSYDDADGGKQVIEVLAEAIQAEPTRAYEEAWGIAAASNAIVVSDN